MKKSEYRVNITYEEFAPMFKAENFVPRHWAELFAASGAKLVTQLFNIISNTLLVPGSQPFSIALSCYHILGSCRRYLLKTFFNMKFLGSVKFWIYHRETKQTGNDHTTPNVKMTTLYSHYHEKVND